MGLILNIDTSSEKAHVSIAGDGKIISFLNSESQKEHASFLQSSIKELIKITGIPLKNIDAVAVTAGPGSYTGLRVGLASAKGICYALNKPLITLGTLEVLAASALQQLQFTDKAVLLCPMMDARRMEVFTALFHNDLSVYMPPCALILDESSFEQEFTKNKIVFFGSGSDKWKLICKHSNAHFGVVSILPETMCEQSNILYNVKIFTELAYSEPTYLKEFQTVIKKQNNSL